MPGHTANPAGRPKTAHASAMVLALTRGGMELIQAYRHIARGNKVKVSHVGLDGKVRELNVRPGTRHRLHALDQLMAYGFGKPVQAVEATHQGAFIVQHRTHPPGFDPLAKDKVVDTEARVVPPGETPAGRQLR